jgi:hypothetical protein
MASNGDFCCVKERAKSGKNPTEQQGAESEKYALKDCKDDDGCDCDGIWKTSGCDHESNPHIASRGSQAHGSADRDWLTTQDPASRQTQKNEKANSKITLRVDFCESAILQDDD